MHNYIYIYIYIYINREWSGCKKESSHGESPSPPPSLFRGRRWGWGNNSCSCSASVAIPTCCCSTTTLSTMQWSLSFSTANRLQTELDVRSEEAWTTFLILLIACPCQKYCFNNYLLNLLKRSSTMKSSFLSFVSPLVDRRATTVAIRISSLVSIFMSFLPFAVKYRIRLRN